MSRIRILHFTKVINRNDFIDVIVRNADPQKYVMHTAAYQAHSNIEDPQYIKDGIPFYSLDIKHGYKDLFVGAHRLSKILRKEKIQILHTHHYYESVIGRLACWLYPACKHVIGRHYHDQFYITASGFKLKYYLFVESIVNYFSAAIVVPSTAIVDLLIEQKVNKNKIHRIPYCFDFTASRYQKLPATEIAAIKKELNWGSKFVIGNIGRHHSIKGQTYLLKAFKSILKKIPDSILVMIGDGPVHNDLVKEAKELAITDHVQFLGWRRDGHTLINAMDVVVHPTLQEAFPQIMIEAMALGKPLIITPVSGATDVIKDGENGLIIPVKSPSEIEEKICFIRLNPAISERISENAYIFVREHFMLKKIIPQFEDLYHSLIINGK